MSGAIVEYRTCSGEGSELIPGSRQTQDHDAPPRSERSARWQRVLAAIALVLATLMAGGYLVGAAASQGITAVRIAGEFRYLSRDALRERVNGYLKAGFFGVNVAALREAVLALPWVRAGEIKP